MLPRIVLPLAWADVRGAEHHHAGGSYSNRDEALAVASLVVHSLLYVDAARVGVICLYRAQASAVQRLLENVAAVVRRPVPQAVGALCASLAATAAAAGADAAPTQDIATLARRAAAVKVSTVDAFQGEARPVFLLLLLLFAHPCSHPIYSFVCSYFAHDALQGDERDVVILSCVRSALGSAAAGGRGGASGFVASPERLCVALTRARRHLLICGNRSVLVRSDPLWRAVAAACVRVRRAAAPAP